MTPLAPHLTAFLRDHLPRERGASPHTIASYADSFVLLLRFAAARVKREPADLQVEDLDVALVRAFLNHLESNRGNGARSRHCPVAPEILATAAHFSMSLRRKASNSAGDIVIGVAPWRSHAVRISGRAIALLISALSLSTIGFGVAAGAMMPIQMVAS